MQAQSTSNLEAIVPRNGVIVLSGYGLRVMVERSHLVLTDGVGRFRRTGMFARATCGIRRLIVVGHSGVISFEALRWLSDIGASFAQVDSDGSVVAAFGPSGLDDARLRRAQATALATGQAAQITRRLLRDKLSAQLALLASLPEAPGATDELQRALHDLDAVDAPADLRRVEARGALAYWNAWAPVAMQFPKKDEPKVPTHWRTFGTRSSPLTGQPRLAANPINALLNYSYAILETEGTIACLAMGLDPGIGLLHADQRSRASLTLDVIEPIRRQVDAFVLAMLRAKVFPLKEFFETREGNCRLMPTITKALGEQAPTMARWLAPVVERLASDLFRSKAMPDARSERLPTMLTKDNRSAGRDGIRVGARKTPKILATLPTACKGCGVMLDDGRLVYCADCGAVHGPEQDRLNMGAALATLAELREAGSDPAHGSVAKRKRAETLRENMRLNREWEESNIPSMTEDEYRERILPTLASVPSQVIMEAMGVTRAYALDVRNGRRVPHQRHWESLARIGQL